jgi:hypothetical protein
MVVLYVRFHVQNVPNRRFLKAFFHCRLQWRCHFKMLILLQVVAASKDSLNFQTQAYNLYIVSNNPLIYSKMHLMWVLKLISNVHIHAFLQLLYLAFVKQKWRNISWAQLPLVAKMGNLSSLFWGKEWGGAGGLASYQFLSYQQSQVHGLINHIDTKEKCYYLKYWPWKGLCCRCLSEPNSIQGKYKEQYFVMLGSQGQWVVLYKCFGLILCWDCIGLQPTKLRSMRDTVSF